MLVSKKIAVIDMPSIDPKQFYIVLGGDDGPQEINPRYLGIFSDWEAKQYVRDQHEKNGTSPDDKDLPEEKRPQPILMLARVGALQVGALLGDEKLAKINADTQARWREAADAKEWRKATFEKYFFGLTDEKFALQGTSSLVSTVAEAQALIDDSHAKTRDMNDRHRETCEKNGTEFVEWPLAKYFISVFRVEVNSAQMIQLNHASYMVMHKPEDFEWNLGDEYDDNGKLTSMDYTKKFPKDYRAEPADVIAKMMENIRISREVGKAVSDTYDRLRNEGRLCEDSDEEAVLRVFRERRKSLANRK